MQEHVKKQFIFPPNAVGNKNRGIEVSEEGIFHG